MARDSTPANADAVWIVSHDESPLNAVLGVFLTEREASDFADQIEERFENGVIYSRYAIGYRYDQRPGHVTFEG